MEIWGTVKKTHIEWLLKLPKKIIRIISYTHYLADTAPLFTSLSLLQIHKVIQERHILLMFKIQNTIFLLLHFT